jgi:hypothetical protein
MLQQHPSLVTEIVQNFSKTDGGSGSNHASSSTTTSSPPAAKSWRRVSCCLLFVFKIYVSFQS